MVKKAIVLLLLGTLFVESCHGEGGEVGGGVGSPITGKLILGQYKLTKSENFDAYLEAVGVGFFYRKMGSFVKPTTDIVKHGDDWTMTTSSTWKTVKMDFRLGVPFDETTIDGRKCKSVVILKSETEMLHTMNCDDKRKIDVVREFSPEGMTMRLEAGGVKSKRFYERTKR